MVRSHTEPLAELELRARGLRLAALRAAGHHPTPILALHGWLDNAASFEPLAALLVGHELVAVDLPGHGKSAHRAPWEHYHFTDWVAVAFDVADALGWERFHLLGHSMGAGIATLAAAALPERIGKLVLLDGLGPLTESETGAAQRLRAFLTQRSAAPRPATYPDHGAAATRLRQALPQLSVLGAQRLVRRGSIQTTHGVQWSSDWRLRHASASRFTEAQVQAFLRSITAPTLVIRAREGYSFDAELLTQRLACLERTRYVEVPGGHHVHLDAPEVVAPHILSWLSS